MTDAFRAGVVDLTLWTNYLCISDYVFLLVNPICFFVQENGGEAKGAKAKGKWKQACHEWVMLSFQLNTYTWCMSYLSLYFVHGVLWYSWYHVCYEFIIFITFWLFDISFVMIFVRDLDFSSTQVTNFISGLTKYFKNIYLKMWLSCKTNNKRYCDWPIETSCCIIYMLDLKN